MKLLASVSVNLPWPGPKKPVHWSKINKGVRARNRVMNAAMWEDRKHGLSYGQIAKKYGLPDPMQVRNRFRYHKLPFRELTQELRNAFRHSRQKESIHEEVLGGEGVRVRAAQAQPASRRCHAGGD